MSILAAGIVAFATPTQPGAAQPPAWMQFAPIVLMGVVFYFLLLRPMQKRQKDHARMLETLKPGDRVVCAGGLHATVVGVTDATVQVKIADQIRVDVEKSSVTTVKRAE
ncbi:MAG TPA: preprotein translocase subunit YajC [Candidatus Polarisedimenticolaceae bacterium]|nr:preprotein translocase subunit YajC [Candidatus Polarisedimenticolaceae bacterium]